jgi:hypothetical protein
MHQPREGCVNTWDHDCPRCEHGPADEAWKGAGKASGAALCYTQLPSRASILSAAARGHYVNKTGEGSGCSRASAAGVTHPHVVLKPACTLQQNHRFLCQEVCDRAIQLLVGQQIIKGMFALGAPLLAQRPLQYTVHCRAQQIQAESRVRGCCMGCGCCWFPAMALQVVPLQQYIHIVAASEVWGAGTCPGLFCVFWLSRWESAPVYAQAEPPDLCIATVCSPQYWCSQPLTRAISTRGVRSRHIAQVMSSASSAESAVSPCNAGQQTGARELRAGAPMSDKKP